MAEDVRNFGPLLPKMNGKELGKFVYLRLNNSKGNLKIISVENEEEILVKILSTSTLNCLVVYMYYLVCSKWVNFRV
jgi:hypothetical protein